MNLYIKKQIRLLFDSVEEITGCYRSLQADYPKFFKMDGLSKLGFLASEIIFGNDDNRFNPCENIAVLCFNRSSSLDADTLYQATVADSKNYFPSPSMFVYTLPNIVAGEICIRHKIQGENTFFIEYPDNPKRQEKYMKLAMNRSKLQFCITGRCEYLNNKYKAEFRLIKKDKIWKN
jgi:hypothetical protein